MGPRDVLRAIEGAIALGGVDTASPLARRDIRPTGGRQLPLPSGVSERARLEKVFCRYVQISYTRPKITSGIYLEHGKPAGCVLVAAEGNRKSVQVLPDNPNPLRAFGWDPRW